MAANKRSILKALLSPIATALTGFVGGGYNATDPRRKLIDRQNIYPNKASANTLLNSSGATLRSYCRQLERNNPSARAGVEALVGLVIGSGIDLAPETGSEFKDKRIRDAFCAWLCSIGVDGSDIYRLQQLAMREVVVVGEFVWRLVPGEGQIPLRILPLESEWLSDQEGASPSNGCTISAGMELDSYGQPTAYFLAPPEIGKPEKVPARFIIHGYERRRALQNRGEPWLSPVIETLMNERDLVDAELKSAVNGAGIGVVVTSEIHPSVDTTEYGDSTDPAQSIAVGNVTRLYPGEKIESFAHTRPSQQISPFRQMLRGDLAAALRIPQRYLDRDVSRANYSSMRADMLDTDRLLSPVREWMGHYTIGALYKVAAPYLAASLGFPVDPNKYRLLPDAQPYVDPVKDVQGSADAIKYGLSTYEAEISKRGGDYRQVWKQKALEQKLANDMDLIFGDQPTQPTPEAEPVDPNNAAADGQNKDEAMSPQDAARMERMERMIEGMAIARSTTPSGVTVEQRISMDPTSAEIMGRAIAQNQPAPVINVPQQAAPIVNVAAPEIRMESRQRRLTDGRVDLAVAEKRPG